MAISLKCRMCGGDLEVIEGESVAECLFCGSRQTVPQVDDGKLMKLYERAARLLRGCEFDKAAGVYEQIITQDDSQAEAYWGMVLCRYGIEYVDDPAGGKVPTLHRASFESVMNDADFELACENADVVAAKHYREQAKEIERLRRRVAEVSGAEEPYDVFICYKETDPVTGERTLDSVLAQDVYKALEAEGYRVFFSRITLEGMLGRDYEPYIFAALNSAKVMLAFGTDFDYFDAVWVKNEWSRFLRLMEKDTSKHLIPCYKGIDPYDMPPEFARLQGQDLGKVGAIQDLLRGIEKLIRKKASESTQPQIIQQVVSTGPTVESLLKRAQMALEDGEWDRVNEFCEQTLNNDAECAEAYLYKCMADLKVHEEFDLGKLRMPIDCNANFVKALRFAVPDMKARLEKVAEQAAENSRADKAAKEATEELLMDRITSFRNARSRFFIDPISISAGDDHTVALKTDGTCVAVGANADGQCDVSKWRDVVAVSAGDDHTVALKADGTCVAVGASAFGQCDVSGWRDVVAVSAGDDHTVALMTDGTCVAVGASAFGQCDVSKWRDVVAISTGSFHTVALKADGTCVAVGNNEGGRCDVSKWRDVVAISAGMSHTVALKADGTCVAVGDNGFGQCDVSGWRDVVAVSAGDLHTVALKADGTCVAVGSNAYGQCDVSKWRDVVAISAGSVHTVALKADGTCVAVGSNHDGRCRVSKWRDVVAVSAGDLHTVAFKADGTCVAVGSNAYGRCDVSGWDFQLSATSLQARIEQLENIQSSWKKRGEELEECRKKRNAEREERKKRGLCQYCGGQFKGLLTKKCTDCGKPKDY